MIDVHLITLPDTRRDWLDQCLCSVADEPITLHRVEGVIGNIGAGRAEGFSRGAQPYVSFVDPDDWVLPGAFSACLDVLESNPDVVCAYTMEAIANDLGTVVSYRDIDSYRLRDPVLAAHHVAVFRRDAISEFLPELSNYHYVPELYLKRYVQQNRGRFMLVPMYGYVWRLHPQCSHKTMISAAWQNEYRALGRLYGNMG